MMGDVRLAEKVCLISAICIAPAVQGKVPQILKELTELWGPISEMSPILLFNHTEYYKKEMGKDLSKFYCSFEQFIPPMEIVQIKHQSNKIEEKYSKKDKRQVNIDPGYIETPKLILATTKNFSHRIYLGDGIYGDVQLIWRGGRFIGNPWTYPDYLEKDTISFFTSVRNTYMKNKEPINCP
jgi:hypothetical protein